MLFGKLTVRVQQLYIAAYDLTHCDRIALVQIFTKAEILIQRIAVLLLTQFPDKFSKIIRDETVVVGEMLRAEFWDLPAGNVTMQAIQKCSVCSHFRRERVKQAGGF